MRLCCFALLSLMSVHSLAGTARSTFTVGASVQAIANVQQSNPSTLMITRDDIQRGYVEVVDPLQLRVASNSTQGYSLELLPVNEMFSSVVVHGLDNDVVLGEDGGTIVQRWQHAQAVSLALRFRFAIRPGIQPGEYSWPLQLSVRPL